MQVRVSGLGADDLRQPQLVPLTSTASGTVADAILSCASDLQTLVVKTVWSSMVRRSIQVCRSL